MSGTQMKPSNKHFSITIAGFALLVGIPAFLAGFFGPLFFSEATLGPLLGILVTGPVGTIVGAAWGVGWAARKKGHAELRRTIAWLCVVWLLALLYTWFLIGLATQLAWAGVVAQGVVLAAAVVALYTGEVRSASSSGIDRLRPVLITSIALVLVLTVFPPVVRPWWASAPAPGAPEADAPRPWVAFMGDPRFDSRRQVPRFAVNRPVLALEWLLAAGATFGLGRWMMVRGHRPAP